MASIVVETEFDLSDYFSKYGFGDGDDSVAKRAGEDFINLATEVLQKTLTKYKVKWTLKPSIYEQSSFHNDLLIVASDENGQDLEFEADCESLIMYSDNEFAETFKNKVWPEAYKIFNNKVKLAIHKNKLTRVENTFS